MKTANVLQQDPLNFSQPRISYTSATRAHFLWSGELRTVETCSLEILTEFLMHHAVCARLPAYQLNELKQLLGYGELGRWQALDTLLTFGVALPLEHVT